MLRNLLLRSSLHCSLYDHAGRIKTIQLDYTEAHHHLVQAICKLYWGKSPTSLRKSLPPADTGPSASCTGGNPLPFSGSPSLQPTQEYNLEHVGDAADESSCFTSEKRAVSRRSLRRHCT